MKREEFMSQLERLLGGLPEEDRQDALAYYEDYFEEAGPEQEDRVIQDLGSPGKVAAMIRADLRDGERSQGEFTENGYQDARFQEQRQTPARRAGFGRSETGEETNGGAQEQEAGGRTEDEAEAGGRENGEAGGHSREFRKNIWQQRRDAWRGQERERWERRQPQGIQKLSRLVWLFFFLVVIIPIVFGVGGGILGVLGGLLAAALGIAFSGLAMIGSGIYHIVISAARFAANPAAGFTGIGAGLLTAAFGILMFLVCIWLAFRVFPRGFRWAVGLVRGIFRRSGGGRDGEEA